MGLRAFMQFDDKLADLGREPGPLASRSPARGRRTFTQWSISRSRSSVSNVAWPIRLAFGMASSAVSHVGVEDGRGGKLRRDLDQGFIVDAFLSQETNNMNLKKLFC